MSELLATLGRLRANDTSSAEQWTASFQGLMAGEGSDAEIGELLTLLAKRGESSLEIAAGAKAMRAVATKLSLPADYQETIVDTCGTGGDRKGWLNISTAAAVVLASMGVPVLKHGNRAQTSQSGSADVLETLGVAIDVDPSVVVRCLREVSIGFAFAPRFHSATKRVAPIRKALGIRTIFNLLGPLSNPARPRYQTVGVFEQQWLAPMAQALLDLGGTRGYVIWGHAGSDEVAVDGPTYACRYERSADGVGKISLETLQPADFGLHVLDSAIAEEQLHGGDAAFNAGVLRSLFRGELEPDHALVHSVAMSCALVLVSCGRAPTLNYATELALAEIVGGAAERTLSSWAELSTKLAAEQKQAAV